MRIFLVSLAMDAFRLRNVNEDMANLRSHISKQSQDFNAREVVIMEKLLITINDEKQQQKKANDHTLLHISVTSLNQYDQPLQFHH